MKLEAFSTVRFSTADLPEKGRAAMWREHIGRTSMKLDIEPLNNAPLECSVLIRALPGVQMMSTAMSPTRIRRTREVSADGKGDLIFIINQSGTVVAQSRGRDITLREGDAVLMSSGDTKVFDRPVHGGSLSFRIPRSILSSIVADIDDVVMQLIPQKSEALKLLAGYAAPLFHDIPLATPEFRRTAVNHLHDLVGLALGSAHDGTGLGHGRGVPAARLRMAKAYIVEHSNRHDLSVGSVSAHLSLTPRNVQRLFEGEGTTFSEFLLSQRLSRAHRMLTEPRFARSPVAAIAYDVGFNDLSYFNRSFKRRYGACPRDIRIGAERSVGFVRYAQQAQQSATHGKTARQKILS